MNLILHIENADTKLLNAIKSIVKLSPNSKLKIEETPTAETYKAIKECGKGNSKTYKDFKSYMLETNNA
ncbi:hypothetical protein [Helicobacter colisuis]|uniref:hypothetical protein n=1 Tax=Helicobacter colisuis TaxID=2949739 RepID=UPI00202AA871|nr:hypothetical protein [Helicobacter colisuis]MCL9823054.1 hypothetical protein [Helicobacter colisuis]